MEFWYGAASVRVVVGKVMWSCARLVDLAWLAWFLVSGSLFLGCDIRKVFLGDPSSSLVPDRPWAGGGERRLWSKTCTPVQELAPFWVQGWHCLGGAIGTEKQVGGRKMLRVDRASPLIFSTASPGDSSCFPLGEE